MGDIAHINEKVWTLGEQRVQVIRPLAEQRRCSRASILEAATLLNLSEWYIYRLIKKYRCSHGLLTSVIPQKPNGGKGKSRLSQLREDIVQEVMNELYLTPQKHNSTRIIEETRKRCFERNVKPPSPMTIRRRLGTIPAKQLKIRGESGTQTQPIWGAFPDVKYPLSVVQIDHTLVDIILVDPVDRLPIGRPYLTLAIDVYSRCIAGFVLSLEAPSAVSVGLCLTHISMEKEPWLEKCNIEAEWPIYGKPWAIHVDNGSDFHSEALTRGCNQHGIHIEYRPPGQPHYGGIIERVIGTLMQLIHALPGTTFSNIEERGNYNSDKHACLTLAELEHWLIITITKYYHVKLHKGIHEPPIKRYEYGVALMKRQGETFDCIQDSKAFTIDFLPIIYRNLRRDGFTLDHITYYSHALRPFICELGKYGKFLIRRDPRDLSRIYVCLPDNQGYLDVPYRTLSHPAISLFEHRLALKRLRDKGKQHVDEYALFKAIDELRRVIDVASLTTRSMRRNRTRLAENKKNHLSVTKVQTEEELPLNVLPTTTKIFTNIEVWE